MAPGLFFLNPISSLTYQSKRLYAAPYGTVHAGSTDDPVVR